MTSAIHGVLYVTPACEYTGIYGDGDGGKIHYELTSIPPIRPPYPFWTLLSLPRRRLIPTQPFPPVDDDASPEVLETMQIAANIHEDDTITPDGGKLMVGQDMLILQHFLTSVPTTANHQHMMSREMNPETT